MLRIIGGSLKGRKVMPFPGPQMRPTSDRVREAMINTVGSFFAQSKMGEGPWEDLRILDAFAGSGLLGIEMISRGVKSVDFIEADPQVFHHLTHTLEHLGLSQHALTQRCDFFQATFASPYDLIFLDPPYHEDLLGKCLRVIRDQALLRDQGLILCEHPKKLDLDIPHEFMLFKQRDYGATRVTLLVSKEHHGKGCPRTPDAE